jgi:hypothetical protein
LSGSPPLAMYLVKWGEESIGDTIEEKNYYMSDQRSLKTVPIRSYEHSNKKILELLHNRVKNPREKIFENFFPKSDTSRGKNMQEIRI